ncbi:RloB-like protein [Corynebacterium mustelae]|uniref:RloB-like protein n=2 Tax=Corynebacterium mustelae TaxID=571915 RepID=A0A0G3H3Q5_9CORY|nr:RloB-like protein [Corynebacterium mustelae]
MAKKQPRNAGPRLGRRAGRGPNMPEHKHVLVVTEGTCTEPQYFENLGRVLNDKKIAIRCIPKGAKGNWNPDPLSVVEKAIEERDARDGEGRSKFVECFAIVDVDEWGDKLEKAMRLAQEEGITVIVSNPCFEVWLAMHSSKKCPSTKREIRELVEKEGLLMKEGKSLPPDFPKQDYEVACENAKTQCKTTAANKIGPVPSTAMPVFFDLVKRHFSED